MQETEKCRRKLVFGLGSSDPALPLTRPAALDKSFRLPELQFSWKKNQGIEVDDLHIFFHLKNGCCSSESKY